MQQPSVTPDVLMGRFLAGELNHTSLYDNAEAIPLEQILTLTQLLTDWEQQQKKRILPSTMNE